MNQLASEWLVLICPLMAGFDLPGDIGSFETNQYGLYDMGGNVWQWCEDWYYTNNEAKVLRGASWLRSSPTELLSSYRGFNPPDTQDYTIGFRIVLATSPR